MSNNYNNSVYGVEAGIVQEQQTTAFSPEFIDQCINTLPLLPRVATQLKQLSQESVDFYPKIAELAEHDPLLATKILCAAHTVPCGPLKPVYNIEKALERIGVFNTLKLIDKLSLIDPDIIMPDEQFNWRHSIEVAVYSRFLAENISAFNVSSDLAYMAGLIHDIGHFVLLHISLNAGESRDTLSWNTADEQSELEQQHYGFNHADMGYRVAQRWNLPRTLTNMLRFHQHYDLWAFKTVSVAFKQLLTIVQFADALSVLTMQNPEWPAWSTTQLKGAIEDHCIHTSWPPIEFPLERLIEQLPALSEQCQWR
ncbi:HDOD domain-containing protein [Amphritea sp.]|uniref:HDOD domain-containing protein n=1 Tax=Amphritea sp. TaxID=1872502 RepID=UPI003A8CE1F3